MPRGRTKMPKESVPYRFVGLADGTDLSYEPAAPTGAPTTLALGEVATVDTAEPFVVRSQGDATFSTYVSYAYPAGMSVKSINKVEIEIPTPD
jgi:hypothetical protein